MSAICADDIKQTFANSSCVQQLGLLGFLASETLMKDGTANAGLLDQRASFEWLQRHVASFGGDPNKITISVSLALKST